jgi:long-chain acyl-CoA synthetase
MEQFLLVNIVIGIIQLVTLIIDIVTFPIYYVIQMPWKKKSLMNKTYAVKISSGEDEVTYKSVEASQELLKDAEGKDIDTMEKMLNYLRQKFASQLCLGTREIISLEEEASSDGEKVWKKYSMGEYRWITYEQMFQKSLAFGRGIKELGYPPKTNVIMYADTRGQL